MYIVYIYIYIHSIKSKRCVMSHIFDIYLFTLFDFGIFCSFRHFLFLVM